MNPLVTLRCPWCKYESAPMPCADFDPHGTAVVEIICDDCDDGDFHEPTYFDATGKWIDPSQGQAA